MNRGLTKWITAAIACAALFVLLSVTAAALLLGDLNADGAVNTKDVLAIRKYLAEIQNPADLAAGDMNGDGKVNTKDLLLLRQKLAQFTPSEPGKTEPTQAQPTQAQPTAAPKTLATGKVMKITTDYAETFSGDITGDYSAPLNAYLPASTLDVLKKEVTDPKTGYTYYLLGCGRRVYTEDAELQSASGKLTENTLACQATTVSAAVTELAFDASWHIPFQLQLKPQTYPYVSQMGDFGPKYDVSSFTATYVEMTFSYTTLVTGTVDVSKSALFSSATFKKNSDNTYTLKLNLKKTGAFYGYTMRWDKNRMIFSFKHKTSIAGNTAQKPLTGVKVVVDAGHGGEWSGTYGSIPNLYEKTLTLQFAKKLQSKLTALGATVTMTRTTDVKVEMNDVTALTRKTNADLFISIHMDGVSSTSANGPTAFYYNEYSQALAKSIINKMDDVYQAHKETTYRGAKWNPYFVTRNSTCPAVLIECGFMTNAAEEKLLVSDSFQNEIAAAMANGITDYLKTRP